MQLATHRLAKECFEQAFGRPGDYMASNEFASVLSGLGAGFDRSSHAADIATHNGGYQGAADADSLDDLYVGSLCHRVGRFYQADEALCFDQSNRSVH
jgi:hypothetical protein